MAFDFKKEYKEFYLPGNTPEIVTVPKANLYLMSLKKTSAQAVLSLIRYNSDNGGEFSNPKAIEYREYPVDGKGLRTII